MDDAGLMARKSVSSLGPEGRVLVAVAAACGSRQKAWGLKKASAVSIANCA